MERRSQIHVISHVTAVLPKYLPGRGSAVLTLDNWMLAKLIVGSDNSFEASVFFCVALLTFI